MLPLLLLLLLLAHARLGRLEPRPRNLEGSLLHFALPPKGLESPHPPWRCAIHLLLGATEDAPHVLAALDALFADWTRRLLRPPTA